MDERVEEKVPQIIQEWIAQLARDKVLHGVIELVEASGEMIDVEMVVVLRGSHGRSVLEPRITIRR